ncbi:MAG TPA: M1 family metallopeptidase [Ohtaekwangia sp.]|uniref:M1 family metallopeptidase n=1 Tax=Ohtaekwangia sp. TaxID=2066019 RepID=UPI002F95FEFD
MKKLIFTTCIFLLLTTLTYSKDYPKNENIDVKKYIFELTLSDSTNTISGKATVTVQFRKAVSEFELDLVNKDASGSGMEVTNIMADGKTIKFLHQNDRLKIILPAPVNIASTISFTIIYSGVPRDGLIISKNKFGDRTFFGDNWPNRAHHWLPTVDHPSDKAAVDFIVTAPPKYEVISNGIKIEESNIGNRQKLTHWHEDTELSPKVMVIGAARFAIKQTGIIKNFEVTSWVYPQNREEGFEAYKFAPRILDFFDTHVGPYSYKKLANVQSTTRYGGMENASNIFYFENSVVTGEGAENNATKNESLVAHEIAHQWFGNSASETDWHHVWLSEGFATYLTHLYTEFTYGRDRMTKNLQEDRDKVIGFYQKTKLPIVFPSLPGDLLEILSPNSYQKGSWVLHMLRYEIGDEAFWSGLQSYYHSYRNSNASTENFKQAMEDASGKKLDTFFAQWLYRAGHPIVEWNWAFDVKTQNVTVTVNQVQPGEAFNTPLEIGIYGNDGLISQTEVVRLDKKSNKFSFKIGQKPFKIALDPNTNLLYEGKIKN